MTILFPGTIMFGQSDSLLSYVDEVCPMAQIRAGTSLVANTARYESSLYRSVEVLIPGDRGTGYRSSCCFINSAKDPAILGTEECVLQNLSMPPRPIPCFSGCLFVISPVAFCIAISGSELLSDIRALCYYLWILLNHWNTDHWNLRAGKNL